MLSLSDDADATNSTSSKSLPHTTKDENIAYLQTNDKKDHFHVHILKKMDLVVEHQKKHTDQLEKLNKNLEKLIDIFTDKFA